MSLHSRKSIAKITALPHCSRMSGGGGFTGQRKTSCHIRSRYGKRQQCVMCKMGSLVSSYSKSYPGRSFWISPGSFIMRKSQLSANTPRTAELIKKPNCGCGVGCGGECISPCCPPSCEGGHPSGPIHLTTNDPINSIYYIEGLDSQPVSSLDKNGTYVFTFDTHALPSDTVFSHSLTGDPDNVFTATNGNRYGHPQGSILQEVDVGQGGPAELTIKFNCFNGVLYIRNHPSLSGNYDDYPDLQHLEVNIC